MSARTISGLTFISGSAFVAGVVLIVIGYVPLGLWLLAWVLLTWCSMVVDAANGLPKPGAEPDTEAAIRAFALKEAELNGWRVPEDFPEHESFDALIAERMELWREEVKAAVEAA